MKLTFVDSGVLIAAARGQPELQEPASAVLVDPIREFASSDFVRLEDHGRDSVNMFRTYSSPTLDIMLVG